MNSEKKIRSKHEAYKMKQKGKKKVDLVPISRRLKTCLRRREIGPKFELNRSVSNTTKIQIL